MQMDPPDHASCWLVDEDLFHWIARINGPDATPYAGGHFMLDVRLPPDYPHKPLLFVSGRAFTIPISSGGEAALSFTN